MDVNTILKLIDAGYTKADIEAMNTPAETEVTEAPAEEVAEPVEEVKEEQPAMTSDDILQNLLAEVKGLKAQIQSNNIRNDSFNMNNSPDLTAEGILASIINPKKEGK